MRDNKKRIEVMISRETGDYIEMMSFDELEEKYGVIQLPERLVNKVIKASVSWNLKNGVMFLTVQNGISINVIQYRLGHSDIKTTLKTYTHIKFYEEKEILNILD